MGKPFPQELIYDDADAPAGHGWDWRAMLDSGKFPEDFQRFFDRDPERSPPRERGLLLAPADGILELRGGEFVVHLRLTDVHVQRFPLPGIVSEVRREGSGYFYPDQEGYYGGVSAVTIVDSAFGRYTVRQHTTLITKRIETFARPGQPVEAGERLGRIRLGSTVVFRFDSAFALLAKDGQKVVAGETILARAA